MDTLPKFSDAKLDPSATFPATYWLTYLNPSPGWTQIIVPSSGTLWVYYSYSQVPATKIYVFHQGGTTTPINLGENSIPVGVNDSIVYQLANPGTDSIKLGYQMM
jgi:hypothetical protein